MSIKIKGNSEIECKVDIQKEVFWSTKIEDSGNYRCIEKPSNSAILWIHLHITGFYGPQILGGSWRFLD
jgi:hypothetical protein